MIKFIDQYKEKNVATKYDAGIVSKCGEDFMVACEMLGAGETFSIGQPVYDRDKNLMGYLGIGLYNHLNYSTEGKIRIPVEYWAICLPTQHCVEGKRVYTYWQNRKKRANEEKEVKE